MLPRKLPVWPSPVWFPLGHQNIPSKANTILLYFLFPLEFPGGVLAFRVTLSPSVFGHCLFLPTWSFPLSGPLHMRCLCLPLRLKLGSLLQEAELSSALGEESLPCSCDARMAFVLGLFLVLLDLLAFCSCYCEDQTGFLHLSTAPQTHGSHVNVCWLSYWKLGGDLKQGDFPGPATGQVKRAEGATLGSSVASGTKNQTCLQPQVADCSACSPHNQRRKGHEINL